MGFTVSCPAPSCGLALARVPSKQLGMIQLSLTSFTSDAPAAGTVTVDARKNISLHDLFRRSFSTWQTMNRYNPYHDGSHSGAPTLEPVLPCGHDSTVSLA